MARLRAGRIEKEIGATIELHEVLAADVLAEYGYDVLFLKPRGYGFINVCQAFVDAGVDLTSDGVHPNATGSALWRDTVLPAFTYQPLVQVRVQSPSSLLGRGDNLLTNATFTAFGGAVPDDWALTNGTAAVDTINFESSTLNRTTGASTTSTAVKFTAAGTGQSTLHQWIPVSRVKGRWVTLAFRVYVPSGQASTVMRASIVDSTGSTLHGATTNG